MAGAENAMATVIFVCGVWIEDSKIIRGTARSHVALFSHFHTNKIDLCPEFSQVVVKFWSTRRVY